MIDALRELNPEFWKFLLGLCTLAGTGLVTIQLVAKSMSSLIQRWAEDKAGIEKLKGENRMKELEAAKEVERLKAEYSATIILQLKATVDGIKPTVDLLTEQVTSLHRGVSHVGEGQRMLGQIFKNTNAAVDELNTVVKDFQSQFAAQIKVRAETVESIEKIKTRIERLEKGNIFVRTKKDDG